MVYKPWREAAEKAAVAAGEVILTIYRSQDFDQFQKGDASPVTSADYAADRLLRERLPEFPVLSEEAADIPWAQRRHWQRYWLVDPLDGTQEFIDGSGDFAVSIALMEDNEPVVGVVHAPVQNVTWFASREGGAWKRTADGHLKAIQCQQLNWTAQTCLRIAISRRHNVDSTLACVPSTLNHRLIRQGSSALKSCMVAEGHADCYPRLGPTGEWDTAAAQCIVDEAGGAIVDTRLAPLAYNKPDLANPHFLTLGDLRQDWLQILRL